MEDRISNFKLFRDSLEKIMVCEVLNVKIKNIKLKYKIIFYYNIRGYFLKLEIGFIFML